jgi:hypothetical protein
MAERSLAYRAILAVLAVGALAAAVFGAYGLYTVLTGGTTDGSVTVDVLGEYDCEEFGGDPEVAHNSSYGVDRTLLSGSVIDSFEASDTEDGLRLEFAVDGGVLGASAARPDGTELPVSQLEDENRVVVELPDRSPVRVWIDSVSEEATVTRTQLDVCPP